MELAEARQGRGHRPGHPGAGRPADAGDHGHHRRAAATRPTPVGLSWTGEPPRLPPIEECQGIAGRAGTGCFSGYAKQVDLRLDPATVGWTRGQPSGTPEMRGYFQLPRTGTRTPTCSRWPWTALPPVVFGLEVVGWSPTVELTWYMRAVPAPGALRVAARCRHVSGGWFDEEAEVWDSAGRLVAQSRQIALVGRSVERPSARKTGPAYPERPCVSPSSAAPAPFPGRTARPPAT